MRSFLERNQGRRGKGRKTTRPLVIPFCRYHVLVFTALLYLLVYRGAVRKVLPRDPNSDSAFIIQDYYIRNPEASSWEI